MKHYTRRIKCVETGVVYNSIKEAAMAHLCYPQMLWKALNKRAKTCLGYHWEYV